MREELGDVLLQVVLQSQIAADAGEFDIEDVAADVDARWSGAIRTCSGMRRQPAHPRC